MLYAIDRQWWERHLPEVRETFAGALVSPQRVAGVQRETAWLSGGKMNSGAAALAQAVFWGAERVVLLGYDCQHDGKATHWHGDHPHGLGNAVGVADWPGQFRSLLPRLARTAVVNASRRTALDMFPRIDLERALA